MEEYDWWSEEKNSSTWLWPQVDPPGIIRLDRYVHMFESACQPSRTQRLFELPALSDSLSGFSSFVALSGITGIFDACRFCSSKALLLWSSRMSAWLLNISFSNSKIFALYDRSWACRIANPRTNDPKTIRLRQILNLQPTAWKFFSKTNERQKFIT